MSEAQSIAVSAGEGQNYQVLVGSDILPRLGEWLAPLLSRPKIAVVADAPALAAQGDKLEAAIRRADIEAVIIKAPASGEAAKNFKTLEIICAQLLDAHIERDDLILSFGGGAIGDVTGLAASLIKRGAKVAHIPTTLLAQTDAAIGGKTAINTAHGKNLIGTFHRPVLVLVDIELTRTLPKREFLSGYAEIVKYGVIKDAEFFSWLEAEGAQVCARDGAALLYAVAASCRAKAAIVSRDEREQGERALLNFGHSFAHALEVLSDHRYLHGEAVAIGMVLAARLSAQLGLAAPDQADRIAAHLDSVGLPIKADMLDDPNQSKRLVEIMRQDKKNKQGGLVLILIKAIGEAVISSRSRLCRSVPICQRGRARMIESAMMFWEQAMGWLGALEFSRGMLIEIALIPVLLVLSGLFSASETAITGASRARAFITKPGRSTAMPTPPNF